MPATAPSLDDSRALLELLVLRRGLAATAAITDASARAQQLLELSQRLIAFCPLIPRLLNRDELHRVVLGLRGAIINTAKALGHMPRDPVFTLVFDVAGRLHQLRIDSLRDSERRVEGELSRLGYQPFSAAAKQVQAWRAVVLQNARPTSVKFEDGVKLEDGPGRTPASPPSRPQSTTSLVTVLLTREPSPDSAIPVPACRDADPGPNSLNVLAAVAANAARPASATGHKRGLSIPDLLGPEVSPKRARIISPAPVAAAPVVAAPQPLPAAVVAPPPPIALPALPPVAVIAPARVPPLAPAPPPLYRAAAAPAAVPFPFPPPPAAAATRPGPGPVGFLAPPWEQPARGLRANIAQIDHRVAELMNERARIEASYRRLTGDTCPLYVHSQAHLLTPLNRAQL
uniref:Uncharacterized protein n=1 Tax=Mycena chlorophos TaxID=658473 RepID=A0ABQ0KW08_MYCCL|nr:predicted protein [Mycena chlorophos]